MVSHIVPVNHPVSRRKTARTPVWSSLCTHGAKERKQEVGQGPFRLRRWWDSLASGMLPAHPPCYLLGTVLHPTTHRRILACSRCTSLGVPKGPFLRTLNRSGSFLRRRWS